jgi:FkbM family methyltransferase
VGKDYFLDCGANVGQSVLHYISKGLITPETEVHLFEPNPLCVADGKENLKEYTNYNFTWHTVALWNENCQKRLTLEYVPGEYADQYGSGKIIKGDQWTGGASNILGDQWHAPAYISEEYIKEGELVDCIDFAEFLWDTIPQDAAHVYLKMDIEGSEFCVLEHLLETETLKCITDIIDLEWHDYHIDPSLDPHDFGIAMCTKVNDLLYRIGVGLDNTSRLASGTFNAHVNISTSKVKFVFTRNGFMCYALSDVPIEAGDDGLHYYSATSFSAVKEDIRRSLAEN